MAKKAKKLAPKRVGRGSDQFILRLPDGMRQRIAEFAEAFGRSMNAEIILRLERSFSEFDEATRKFGQEGVFLDEVKRIVCERDDWILREVRSEIKRMQPAPAVDDASKD